MKKHRCVAGTCRRGAALMMAVVAIAVVSLLAAGITWNLLAGRLLLDRRQRELQAQSLARAGVELAAARLLADTTGYRGETVELLPGSHVRIQLRAESGVADVFRVTSEARFPKDGKESVLRSVTVTLRRTKGEHQVRVEVIPLAQSASGSGDS